jgi:hypothetical protein
VLAASDGFPRDGCCWADGIVVSVHSKGRYCIIDDIDLESLSRGLKLNCKDHRHVGRVAAFEISRSPRLGRLVAFLGSAATTRDEPAPAGCFIEIGGFIEYVHLRPSTKPNLKTIYALGKRLGTERRKPFRQRTYYPAR